MSRVVLADAGPLYAQVDRDDQHHQQARDELATITHTGLALVVIVPVVQETHRLVLQRLGLHVATNWIVEMNQRTVVIATDLDDYHLACTRIARYPDQDISVGDALLSIVSERLQPPVWTYDHHFDVLGAERWYPRM